MENKQSFYGGGSKSFYGVINSYGDINNLYEEKTITGPVNIASFNDGLKNKKIKQLIVAVEPVQDLHGYDAPWPGGGGKNLLDPDKHTTYGNGYGQRWYAEDGFVLKANQAYTFSVTYGNPIKLYIIAKETGTSLSDANNSLTYTPTEDISVYFQAYRAENILSVNTFQLELGSTATSYSPYSNVCPITGFTAASVTRTGKNIIDTTGTTLSGSSVFVGTNSSNDFNYFLKAGTYTLSEKWQNSGYSYWRRKGTTDNNIIHSNGGQSGTFTLPADDWYRFWYYKPGVSLSDITDIMLEVGSSATSYAPYTGQVYDIEFPLLTKNLADMREENIKLGYYIATNGAETAHSSNFIYNQYIPVKANTSYTISMSSSVYFISISEYSSADRNGFIIRKAGSTGSNTKFTVTTGSSTKYIRFGSNVRGSSGEDLTMQEVLAIDWMLEEGSTASDYEPYTSTVYGGSLDVTMGVLTVDRVSVDMGALEWNSWPQGSTLIFYASVSGKKPTRIDPCLCSIYEYNDTIVGSWDDLHDKQVTGQIDGANVYVRDSSYLDNTSFKTAMSGVQLVYELAEPIEYQLDPVTLTTLLGVNNIWASTGSIQKLTYIAKK